MKPGLKQYLFEGEAVAAVVAAVTLASLPFPVKL